ncbi:MAG: hypothetical protein WD471_01255 [Candidatus Paceibacterota bacterium]
MNKDKFVNEENTKQRGRTADEYSKVIEKIEKDGVCPFCSEQLNKYHKNPIIEVTKYWLVTENMYPYDGARVHLLFIHKEHISSLREINSKAWEELQLLSKRMIDKYEIKGGTLFMRFGDTNFNGASVSHLHAQLVTPHKNNEKPILTRIG